GESGALHCSHYRAFWREMVRVSQNSRLDDSLFIRPFWLSPRQVCVIPVSLVYVREVHLCKYYYSDLFTERLCSRHWNATLSAWHLCGRRQRHRHLTEEDPQCRDC